MSLEQRLEALGRELAFPPEPDLAPAVLAQAGRRPFPWRSVALAAAVVAVAVAAALAVPQARTAILRFFHLQGATVIRVEALPPAAERTGLGRAAPLRKVERQVGFRLRLPPLAGGPPRRAYVVGDSLATVVLRAHGTRVLLSEFPSLGDRTVEKLAAGATSVQRVRVEGRPGLWLTGTHTFAYFDRETGYAERPVRIHANVLLWVRGGLTLRLEGDLPRSQALELARLVR